MGSDRLELPVSLAIYRDPAQERELLSHSREWLERESRAPGIHASDLLDPRQAYWRTVAPKPLSDRMVTTFMIGKVLHAIILSAVGKTEFGMTDEGPRESESLGIIYSPDLFNKEPIEIKTSRSFYEPKSLNDLGMYCEQLLIYMAATESTRGHLWVLYLNLRDETGRTSPEFRAYTIELPKEDLKVYAERCAEISATLKRALERKDPHLLPLCREWKCSERMCEWWHECQPEGRYGKEVVGERRKRR